MIKFIDTHLTEVVGRCMGEVEQGQKTQSRSQPLLASLKHIYNYAN